MPEYRIKTISPDWDSFANDIAHNGIPASAQMIYEGRNRLAHVKCNGRDFCIKSFRRPNFVNSFVYTTIRKSKACRSYYNAQYLLSHGFHTPAPIAYMEEREGLRLGKSFYICQFKDARQIRFWENLPHSDNLLKAFASDLVKLHKAGIWHKDFSPGNILWTYSETDGYTFYYIDLNRMEFNVKNRKKLMSMFGTIHHKEDELCRLATYYAEASGEDVSKVRKEALQAFYTFNKRISRKRKIKSFFTHGKNHSSSTNL